ncbi:MAG: hypothetical protein ACR2LA_06120 [Acidimicrobiales bacterium]
MSSTAPGGAPDQPLAMRWSLGRVAIVVAVLAIVGFWAWIFAGGPKRTNPDRLSDREFVTRTASRCQGLRDDLAALPNAVDAASAAGRREGLERATTRVARFVDEVAADAPASGGEARSVDGWVRDWRRYVADRRDYAARLGRDPAARFYVSKSPLGDSVDRTIEVFADVNDMPACATPGDVG